VVTREYECSRHGYLEIELSISAPNPATCPRKRCGRALERVFRTAPPPAVFAGRFAVSGGVPDVRVSESEYSDWQRHEMKRAKDDLHPDNAKRYVSAREWQPKERTEMIREKHERRAKGEKVMR
jgi:hypothetical protein